MQQTSDASTDDEDFGRRNLACRSDLATEGASVGECRLDDGAVTGDIGHRRQCVHRLGARNARDHIHAETGDASCGQLLGKGEVLAGMEKGDEDGSCAHEGDLVVGGFVDGQYEVSLPRLPRFDNPCSGLFIRAVRLSSMLASSGLDDHLVAEFE